MAGDLIIHDHQDRWPAEFLALQSRLSTALGAVALRIDHIGSTSIPGLAAKDIIDIQVTVADLDEATIRPLLEGAGFDWLDGYHDHEPPGMSLDRSELHKLFARAPARERRANIHIRSAGRFNQRYPLLFRDYCRAHPGAAAAYGEVKRALVRVIDDDVEAYYDIKDPVIDILMVGANAWAKATGWEPEPGFSHRP